MVLTWLPATGLVFAARAAASHAPVPVLRRWQWLDMPNARSSHDRPIPRGGGIAPAGLLVLVGLGLSVQAEIAGLAALLGAALALAVLSLADNRQSVGVVPRLLTHGGAVAFGIAAAVMHWPPVLPGLGPGLGSGWIKLALLGIAWLWFINLFNFMDGIDGISGVALIGIGLPAAAVVLLRAPTAATSALEGAVSVSDLMLAAAAAGFLTANRAPARVFLGDVGSITLGFLAGALLIALASAGHVAAAMILPAYHVTDATITLAKRIVRRERLTQAHRTHADQRASQKGLSHADVCVRITILKAVLVGLALASAAAPLMTVVVAYGLSGMLYHYLLHLECFRR